MKKLRLLNTLCVTVISLCVAVPAEAFLMSRLGGAAAYDDVLDITWTTDASLGGRDTWPNQVAWASGLDYLGFDGWRLASLSVAAGVPTGTTTSPVDCRTATELACRDNELGYMFYHNLGGSLDDNFTGDQVVDGVGLTDIQSIYWSGTEFDSNRAWNFLFSRGVQGDWLKDFGPFNLFSTWAVRDGDVAVVPEPPMLLLLATGLLGFIWTTRKKLA